MMKIVCATNGFVLGYIGSSIVLETLTLTQVGMGLCMSAVANLTVGFIALTKGW